MDKYTVGLGGLPIGPEMRPLTSEDAEMALNRSIDNLAARHNPWPSLTGRRIVVYDLEIIKAILGKGQLPVEGIEYCEGFHDKANMGISVLGAYDYFTGRYRVFCGDNLHQFGELCTGAELIVGFNHVNFDNPIVGHHGIPVQELAPHYDIMLELRKKVGTFLRLGPVATANCGAPKSGDGAMAPILWQQGKVGEVVDYCLNDVRMTRLVFEKVHYEGYLLDPRNMRRVEMASPIR